jgi:hypothetical protein
MDTLANNGELILVVFSALGLESLDVRLNEIISPFS